MIFKRNQFKPGMATNFDVNLSPKESLDAIKSAGFKYVMISEIEGDLEESIKYAYKLGLKVPYVHLKYANKDALWKPGSECEKYIKAINGSIKVCAKYKVPIAVMHIVWRDSPMPNKYGLKSMQKILKVAEKEGVKIAIENLAVQGDEQLCYLLDNISSEWLGFCYDVGHHYRHIHDTQLAKRYGNRMIAVHIHDNQFREAPDLHLLPFDGKMDFKEVMQDIANSAYENVMMLEFHKNWTDIGKQLYDKWTPVKSLKVAKKRAMKLAKMVRKYRK